MSVAMTEYPVAQLPAEGAVSRTTEAELDEMTRAALDNVIKRNRSGDDPFNSNTFRVAAFLQAHPRRRLRSADICPHVGLTSSQVNTVLQHLVDQRTDVTRESKGEYMYTPGRGPGIRPKGQLAPAPRELRAGNSIKIPEEAVQSAVVKDVPQPLLVFTELPGVQTSDGRKVVRDHAGVVYAVVELT